MEGLLEAIIKGDEASNLKVSHNKQKASKKRCIGWLTCLVVIKQTRKMFLIVDVPMYQRWNMSRNTASPQRGVCWSRLSRGQNESPRVSQRNSFQTSHLKAGFQGAESLKHWERTFSSWLYSPPSPSEGETAGRSLMTLVSMAMVWMYGSLTILAQDVVEGGWQYRVQAIMQGIPWAMPLPSPFQAPSAFVQRDPRALTLGPAPYCSNGLDQFPQDLGLSTAQSLGGTQSPWCLGPSILSIPSEFEGQLNNSRLESDNELQDFQILTTCLDILFCLYWLMLFHWVVFINIV